MSQASMITHPTSGAPKGLKSNKASAKALKAGETHIFDRASSVIVGG
jgi:hypothetical protein